MRSVLVVFVWWRWSVADSGGFLRQSGGRRNERYDKFAAGARYTQVNFG